MAKETNNSEGIGPSQMRILLVGGSGHVGKALTRRFLGAGHDVVVLSRRPSPAAGAEGRHARTVAWDGRTLGPWSVELDGADVVMNLCGRSVNCRYSAPNRREIMESRVVPTRLIGQAIRGLKAPPRIWMNASTATIYRHALDRGMDEATGEIGGNERGVPASWGFSIEVAKRWEEALFAGYTPGTRRIALRAAVVMTPDRGSIFDVFAGLVRCGLGGTVGSGEQFVSWIHEWDFLRAIEHLIEHEEMDSVVNVSSPAPVPNREFMAVLREAWGVKIGLPASRWMVEIGTWLLRTEPELVLKSRRVIPRRLLESGFRFEFPEWSEAAKDLVARREGKPKTQVQETNLGRPHPTAAVSEGQLPRRDEGANT